MRITRWRLLAGGVAVLAVVASTSAAQAGTAPGAATGHAPPARPGGHQYTATLLTGDVVTVTTGSGHCPQVSVRPARRGEVLTKSCGPDGHVRVIPAQVAGLLGRVVDPALFDVTTLIAQGY